MTGIDRTDRTGEDEVEEITVTEHDTRLLAELWYEQVPDLDDPALVAALRRVSVETEQQSGSLTVPHPDVTAQSEEGMVPLVTVVLPASPLDHRTKTLPDVSQTWDWLEAGQAVERCTGSLLVSELLADLFAPRQRVDALMSVLAVLVERTRPAAISWPASQRVTDPATFDPESLDGVLNVRYFSADEDAMVMDTLGLDLFGLPDLQCHYRDVDPAEVATTLFTAAGYLFAEGDVIDEGDTVSGPRGDERYVCRHRRSLLAPPREVVDVDLGPPHAVHR